MKRRMIKSLLAGITALALLLTCMLAGLVLPASAATVNSITSLSLPEVWVMTGRYRNMGSTSVKYSDGTTGTVKAADMSWEIGDTTLATVDANGVITANSITTNKTGETTLTGICDGVSKTIPVYVVDGSKYQYFTPEYKYGNPLVKNGDFEKGSESWSQYIPNGDSQVDKGKHFLSSEGEGGSGALVLATGAKWRQTGVQVVPTYTYRLSFDYKAPAGTSAKLIQNGGFGTISIEGEDDEWHSESRVYTVEADATGYTTIFIYGEGSTATTHETPVIIDNLEICEQISGVVIQELLISHEELLLQKNESHTLKLQTLPFGGDLNQVQWTTSDPSVATVENGKVTTVDIGTAVITAQTRSEHCATCTVSVVPGKEMVANGNFENEKSTAWVTPSGKAEYVLGAGVDGTYGLKLYEKSPIIQELVGLQPSTVYSFNAELKAATAEGLYTVVTVTNGDNVLATKKQYGSDAWDCVTFNFTTPATLTANVTELRFELFKTSSEDEEEKDDPTETPGGDIIYGDCSVTDPDTDDDFTVEKPYGYIDNVSLTDNKRMTEGKKIDLTPVELTWTGDDGIGQAKPGAEIVFSVAVKNQGSEDLPAEQGLTVDIAAGTKVIRTLHYDGAIAAGETVTITDAQPWEAIEGDHMISARVNASRSIYETNLKTNQTIQLNLRVAEDVYAPAYNKEVIAQAGMDKLTMSDDFNDLSTVDTLASGAEGYKWYVTIPWAGGREMTPYDYMTETRNGNGILTLMGEKPNHNITLSSADINTGNGYRYNKGYLEIKLRVVNPGPEDKHESGIPAVWSFTQDKALENLTGKDYQWVELDWLEYWGVQNQYPGGYYTTTFHHSVCDVTNNQGKVTEVNTNPAYTNDRNHSLEGLGDAEWHVMGWLWENNRYRAFLDGVLVQDMLIDPDASAVPLPNLKNPIKYEDPENENFGEVIPTLDDAGNVVTENGAPKPIGYYGNEDDPGAFSLTNIEKAVLYLSGSKDHPMEVDYVRIWQESEPQDTSDTMTMDRTEVTMDENSMEQLSVSVPNGQDAGTLSWKSSDPSVVTVHGNGDLYARGAGKAVVTATNANGISVMCTVTVQHNLISNGDFEFTFEDDLLYKHWKKVPYNESTGSSPYIATQSGNRVLAFPPKSTFTYANAITLQRGKTYELTGKYQGGTFNMYVSLSNGVTSATQLTQSDGQIQEVPVANTFSIESFETTADGWNVFKIRLTTAGKEAGGVWNVNYLIPQFRNDDSTSSTLYLDDLVLTEVDDVRKDAYTLSVEDIADGAVTLFNIDTGATIESGAAVAPGTRVGVIATPSSGYQLQLGSLEYTYNQPTLAGDKAVTREVLNKNNFSHDENWFGAGDGTEFYFEMPAGDTTLNAAFEDKSSAEQTPVATLGTSVYLNKETNAISGVRFLNRLYYTKMDDNDIYVMYNNQERKVTQFGTLLKRGTSDLALTLESYEENQNGSGSSRIWKTISYSGGDVYAVDYTTAYIDFTGVMTSSVANRYAFLNRNYAVCAYLVLDGVNEPIYTEIFTDSVLGSQARR